MMAQSVAAPQFLPTKTGGTPTRSPMRSPAKRAITISQAQKEALIDNLQLEVTERARRLRAQYALQAQGLRLRLEMRINRIPVALRNMTIGDLLEKYAEPTSTKVASPSNLVSRVPQSRLSPTKTAVATSPVRPAISRKRTSEHMDIVEDMEKENAGAATSVVNPKKRPRTAAPPVASTNSAVSSQILPQILSPRSANNRTLPAQQTPFKSAISPIKPQGARPMSPTKPSVTLTTTAASRAKAAEKATTKAKPASRPTSRQATTRPKRGAPAPAPTPDIELGQSRHSINSDGASSSAGTTIVTQTGRGGGVQASAAAKKVEMAAKKAAGTVKGRKGAVKVEDVPVAHEQVLATVKGGRTLRKRG